MRAVAFELEPRYEKIVADVTYQPRTKSIWRILGHLRKYSHHPVLHIQNRYIAKALGLSEKTVYSAIKELEKDGVLLRGQMVGTPYGRVRQWRFARQGGPSLPKRKARKLKTKSPPKDEFRKRNTGETQKEWYHAYLLSPQWKSKRSLILKRAGGYCEGCGEKKATQVHHLTYENVGNELLWELVAACGSCHKKAHHIDGAEDLV